VRAISTRPPIFDRWVSYSDPVLLILGAERARQLASGLQPLIRCDNKPDVTDLRGVAKGNVRFNEHVEGTIRQYLAEIKSRNNPRAERRYSEGALDFDRDRELQIVPLGESRRHRIVGR
jgi:hypothetical protein